METKIKIKSNNFFWLINLLIPLIASSIIISIFSETFAFSKKFFATNEVSLFLSIVVILESFSRPMHILNELRPVKVTIYKISLGLNNFVTKYKK